jgi:hypothetical protein
VSSIHFVRRLFSALFHRSIPLPEALREAQVPIVVGVTGHRKLAGDLETLKTAIAAQCLELAKRHRSSPFLLLSGLAEGADLILTEIALDTLPDCSFIAVLPMPRAEFEKDFTSETARAKFVTLLARAEAVVEIPTVGGAWREAGAERDALYAQVGALIAEHAQVLLAVWDGQPSGGTGGTRDVMDWFQQGYAPKRYSFYHGELTPLDPPEAGMLLTIDPAGGEVTSDVVQKPAERGTNIAQLLRLTDTYNQSLRKNETLISAGQSPLMTEPQGPVARVYAAADALAIKYRDRVRTLDRAMYLLALIAFLLFNFLEKAPAAVYGYAAVTVAMVIIFLCMWWPKVDDRFREYRALSEAMRVLFFWRLAGVQRTVWLGYLAKHAGLVHWVRHAVRTIEFRQGAKSGRAGNAISSEGVALATEGWVSKQQAFYKDAVARHAKAARAWTRLSSASLFLSYALAIVLLVLAYQNTAGFWYWTNPTLSEGLQITLGVAAAFGLAARSYLTRKADEDLVKHYSSALQIFDAASRQLAEAAETQAKAEEPDWPPEEILERLGIEALREQGEWLWLRHSRPFDVPT